MRTSSGYGSPNVGRIIKFGALILGIFLGIFIIWSLTAELESAAQAPGKIIVAGNRKTIQHLEGGIVKEFYVKEGSVVKANQPLIKLDDTQARANFDLYNRQALELTAIRSRLIAERDQSSKINFPPQLLEKKDDPELSAILQAQKTIFETNQKTLAGQLEIMQQRIEQLNKEIESLQAQVTSEEYQEKLIKEEIKAVSYLEAKKLIEKPRLLALQREASRLEGNRGEHLGLIARAQQKIGEAKQQILTLKDSYIKEILTELRDTQEKLAIALEKKKAAEDVLRRTLITAPQAGTVVGLLEHTVTGVISPGKPIMDIVPNQGELIVEAKISPEDIDVVHPNLTAKVQLTAYKQRRTPWFDGLVTYVSADSFQDNKTGATYYIAYINLSQQELNKLKNVSLYPGMPVHVMIITDKRTAFSYIFSPIVDSFNRAFREE